MKILATFLFLSCMVSAVTSTAHARANDVLDACSLKEDNLQMVSCMTEVFDKEDKRLNKNYAQALRKTAADDKNAGQNLEVNALKKAQRAWLVYLNSQCDSVGDPYDLGREISQMEYKRCTIVLTSARADGLYDQYIKSSL